MRCLKKAIAREMYRELPTTTGVASRLTVRRRIPHMGSQLAQCESDGLGAARLVDAIGDLLINRLGWNCGDRRLNARSQICGQS